MDCISLSSVWLIDENFVSIILSINDGSSLKYTWLIDFFYFFL